MKSLKQLFFLAILVFFITSCNKNNLEATYEITPEEQQYIPYTEGEKVVYINSGNGAELVLTAAPMINKFAESPSGVTTNRYFRYETSQLVLSGSGIDLEYNLSAIHKKYHDKTKLVLYWQTGIEDFPALISGGFDVPIDSADRFYKLVYYDSLMVHQHLYQDVYRGTFSLNYPPGDTTPVPVGSVFPINFYYSLPQGIIKFDLSDSTSWELDRIEKE